MKTSAIQNTAAAPQLPAARQAEATPDTMFNQVLSREMAERAPAETNKPAPSDNGAGKTPPPAARTEKTASAEKPKSADEADADTEDETIPATASAELLALVASLNQASAPAADAAPTDGDAAAGDGKPGRQTSDTGLAALLEKRLAADAPATGEGVPQVATAAEADPLAASALVAASPGDFSAAMESAGELRMASLAEVTADGTAAPPPAAVQAPFDIPQAAAAQAVDKLMPKVGTQDWNQALGQKVVWMVAGSQQSASLTLNPPDLGPLHVVLHVNNSHATATFTAAQPEVRQALESAMPKLREMLGEAGIQLGQASVGAGSPNHQQGGSGGRSSSGRGTPGGGIDDGAAPLRSARTQAITGGNGLVDTFA